MGASFAHRIDTTYAKRSFRPLCPLTWFYDKLSIDAINAFAYAKPACSNAFFVTQKIQNIRNKQLVPNAR
jgi:hypothetical protein